MTSVVDCDSRTDTTCKIILFPNDVLAMRMRSFSSYMRVWRRVSVHSVANKHRSRWLLHQLRSAVGLSRLLSHAGLSPALL